MILRAMTPATLESEGPKEGVYWQSNVRAAPLPPLEGDTEAFAVVVGGGVAGLSAAQWLLETAQEDVVLLEGRHCGSGASGKSSGFITPDGELELAQLVRRFGAEDACLLWRGGQDGARQIRDNIDRLGIACDQVAGDSLFVANSDGALPSIRAEHDAHQQLGFESRLYLRDEIAALLGSRSYAGGVRCGGTFGIDAFAYAEGLKQALAAQGARIHEASPVVGIDGTLVKTARGSVRAKHVFICMDRFAPDLDISRRDTYHAQTFIALSEPLEPRLLERLFPGGPLLVWDSDLIYQYFRVTGDHRLLVGGGSLRYTYARHAVHGPNAAVSKLMNYVKRKFPFLGDVKFTHYWPGLIGVSKDLLPLAGPAPDRPGVHVALCAAGLAWGTLAGRTAARRAIEGPAGLDRFLSPARAQSPIAALQPLFRKPVTFALSNYYAKYKQRG